MKTRPDGSAFRRSNVVYGRQPTQPRPRNDGFHWATPRHPACSRLSVCNLLAYFKYANFGGRSKEMLQQVIGNRNRRFAANLYYVMLSGAVGAVETSPGRVPCEKGAEVRELM